MRINGSNISHLSIASRVSALLIEGCGMVTVVSEQVRSDYALYIDKREAGGGDPEVAALDYVDVSEVATTDKG